MMDGEWVFLLATDKPKKQDLRLLKQFETISSVYKAQSTEETLRFKSTNLPLIAKVVKDVEGTVLRIEWYGEPARKE